MSVNKVIYGNRTLIDLSADTVTADKLLSGYTAHDKSGAQITGTATAGGAASEFVGCRTHVNANGTITKTYTDGTTITQSFPNNEQVKFLYGSGEYILQDFPSGCITRLRLYNSSGTVLKTKTITEETSTGDIIETIT